MSKRIIKMSFDIATKIVEQYRMILQQHDSTWGWRCQPPGRAFWEIFICKNIHYSQYSQKKIQEFCGIFRC